MSKVRILLLEDNAGDAYLVKEQLRDINNVDFQIVEAQYLNEAVKLLAEQSYDAILLDLMLPDSEGLATFFAVNEQASDTAIIVTSGLFEEDMAIDAVKEGAQDYLVKGEIQPKSLSRIIRYAIERKSLTEQLIKRQQELEYLNQELEAFNYTVSHDLKNPLNFIKGMSSLLLSQKRDLPLEKRDRHCLERIHHSSLRMEQITQDLLDLASVKRSPISLEKVNLAQLAIEIAEEFQQQNLKRQVKFVASSDIIAKTDRQLIKLLLENLIGNAWKYTQHAANPNIEFSVNNLDNRAVYCLEDNGIGFDVEEAQELFMPFQRLSNSADIEGTGIGLATVKRIIERLQGEIWFEAELGKGASFMFTLDPLV